MNLQIAIDRVTIEEAKEIIKKVDSEVEIIEIGTSLIKDFGIKTCMNQLNSNHAKILLDLKTIDEGEYEFEQAYIHGAEIATVMGAADISTIEKCQKVAKKYSKQYMIDLLGVSNEKIKELAKFEDAIFCYHTSTDKEESKVSSNELLEVRKILLNQKIFVAGRISPDTLKKININMIQGVVVGSYVTKSDNMKSSICKIRKANKE